MSGQARDVTAPVQQQPTPQGVWGWLGSVLGKAGPHNTMLSWCTTGYFGLGRSVVCARHFWRLPLYACMGAASRLRHRGWPRPFPFSRLREKQAGYRTWYYLQASSALLYSMAISFSCSYLAVTMADFFYWLILLLYIVFLLCMTH